VILAEPRLDARHSLGMDGEAAAARVLQRSGLHILERRYRRRMGEIDLIARQGELVVFVEVKTRRKRSHGNPGAAVNRNKQRRMARVALSYLARRGWMGRPCRFDVVEVVAEVGGRLDVRHIADAFRLWPTG